jgi:hypothetical protein
MPFQSMILPAKTRHEHVSGVVRSADATHARTWAREARAAKHLGDKPMGIKSFLAAVLVVAFTVPALAQAPAPTGTPTRIRGTIEKFDGKILTVKSRDGTDIAITLADNFSVRGMKAVRLSSIKQGDFVGVAALTDTNGKLQAQEVLVFPEAMRGTGEGHYPWDLTPGSTMTNATVAQVNKAPHGRTLELQYKDGTQEINVAPRTPVVTFVPGTTRLLKPGRTVFIGARKLDDGSYVAPAVNVQRGATKPPM